jgi:hypothetical protein
MRSIPDSKDYSMSDLLFVGQAMVAEGESHRFYERVMDSREAGLVASAMESMAKGLASKLRVASKGPTLIHALEIRVYRTDSQLPYGVMRAILRARGQDPGWYERVGKVEPSTPTRLPFPDSIGSDGASDGPYGKAKR